MPVRSSAHWPFLLLLAAACARPAVPLPPAPAPTPTAVPPVEFPRDAGSHDALTEWWYYTGHLQSADTRREYGFEFVVFQVRREASPVIYFAHLAVTDIGLGAFSHQARFTRGAFQPGFNLAVEGWRLTNDGTADLIEAAMEPGPGVSAPYALTLQLTDRKPPALHHGGYIEYGDAGGSYYYSRTRLAVSGRLRDHEGAWVPVSGHAWMDHQWGDFVVSRAGGWDWYSLQLEDNTDLMLYVLRAPTGETSAVYGSQVQADGTVHELAPGSVRTQALGHWTSPHTGATYPSGWLVELDDPPMRLRVLPRLPDQELYFPGAEAEGLAYWEGAVEVAGERAGAPIRGLGYVELTGYAR
jgi:predicted secreted hydrolase